MYSIGDTVEADLHGIPGLGEWTIRATATVLDIQPGRTTFLLLALTNSTGSVSFHAIGRLSTELDRHSAHTVHNPTTDGPQPTQITLGQRIGRHPEPVDADAAYSALSPYMGSIAPGGPLTEHNLPMLDRAVQAVTDRRDQTTAAEQGRDDLIRRFAAGGVDPNTLINRSGLSRTRVYQISKPRRAA